MTTYQDPPLQSRRAVRQGERVEQSTPPFAPPQTPRTAAGAGEPLSYVTQNRAPLPGYDTDRPRGRRASEPTSDALPEPQAPQSFRPRDFSPEARTAPPAWSPDDDRESGMVEYQTLGRAQVVPPQGVSLAASLASEPNEQTLTRRELRAIRDASGIAETPTGAPTEAPAQPTQQAAPPQQAAPQPAPAPAPSTHLDSAMAEFDALAGRSASRRPGRRAAAQSDPTPEAGLGVFEQAAAPAAPPAPAAAPVATPPVASPVPPQPAPPVAEQYPVVLPPSAGEVAPISPPPTGERSVGHWTNQSALDDSTQVNESTISRRIGAGAITTSALVLPSIPGHDMTTGEVMLTDSISLPSSFGSTGAHTSMDESDIDHLLDPGDHQLVNTDSVPIRAIRAVSSHTSTRGVIASHQPKRANRALTALIVSASAMVVVVVTLLVVALSTGVL